MRFIPRYSVIYKGCLRYAGVEFEIDDEDSEEMKAHGSVHQEVQKPPRKPGRPKASK